MQFKAENAVMKNQRERTDKAESFERGRGSTRVHFAGMSLRSFPRTVLRTEKEITSLSLSKALLCCRI